MKTLSQSVKLEYWIKWIPSALSFLLVLQVTDAETAPEEKVSETGKISDQIDMIVTNILYYHLMQIVLLFHWPKALHVTCK